MQSQATKHDQVSDVVRLRSVSQSMDTGPSKTPLGSGPSWGGRGGGGAGSDSRRPERPEPGEAWLEKAFKLRVRTMCRAS